MTKLVFRKVFLLSTITIVAAHSSPQFGTVNLSTGNIAHANYNPSGDVYTIAAKGMGVYWCLDDGGFAYLKDENTSGDFTFTVRLKTRPSTANGHIGIMAKPRLEAHAPVLALRWDYYHATRSLTGLGWFNRITPSERIDPNCGSCRKGCDNGEEFGCHGYAFEGLVPDFHRFNEEAIWMRIIRKKYESSSRYYFLVRSDSEEEFRLVRPLTSDKTPCGGSAISPFLLPYFTVPEEESDGTIYVGIYVAGSLDGGGALSAEFDNISFIESCEVPSMGCLDDEIPQP